METDEAFAHEVEQLCSPAAFPAQGGGDVELITTHISWVLRGRRDVFKLKRPVRYAFVDFSSPEQRRHACEEEVRLNTRLAPDVYGGVVPVYRAQGKLSFVGPGEVVEHAVRMRRLNDADSCRERLARNALSPEHLAALAQRLAAFYRCAPLASAFGTPERLRALVLDNFDEIARVPEFPAPARSIARLRAHAASHLEKLLPRLDARHDGGAVRDGHGDLRLEHVYFEGDALVPVVIDAVEFEPAFRGSDMALDVAFFAMELEDAGRADLAAWLWSCFARALQDYGFYPLIDTFVMYRAAVRAKVAALTAVGAPAHVRRRKRDEARRLFALAERAGHDHHTGRPAVICVGGLVGAGKSVVAEALARAIVGPVISSDHTRKALAGVSPDQQAAPAHYTAAFSDATLQAMRAHATLVLESHRPVVLDATFRSRAWRDEARALATAQGVPFLFVEATCQESVLRARLRARQARPGVSDAREAQLDDLLRTFEPLSELPAAVHLRVDTEQPLADALAAVTARLASG
ncbi:MAG: AAA family ATPase [Myxococcales bacterium]|nr:AAA family ATPase [Myxococcales bacterium]